MWRTDASPSTATDDAIIGVSPWVRRTRALIRRVAASASTVLITGPTGTGKELIARAIHNHSSRSGRPFVVADCAAVADTLFASHMFGHCRGAFTGATHESLGCFRAADGGTIFLDEVGELETDLQVKLLRVLQERVVVPLGGHRGVPIDVRVIAATNRDLRDAVAKGLFREDLYYRLHVVSITTTSLQARPEDITPVANHILQQFAARDKLPLRRLTPAALKRLEAYHWPGNVRQLENLLERAILFGHEDPLDEDVIEEMLSDQPGIASEGNTTDSRRLPEPSTPAERHDRPQAWPTMADVEREHLLRTLRHTGYNQSATARLLGWDRNQLRRKMRAYGLTLPSARPDRPAASGKSPDELSGSGSA